MATYGAYPRDRDGNVIVPPMTFEATNNLVAIAQRVGIVQRQGLEERALPVGTGFGEPFASALACGLLSNNSILLRLLLTRYP
jgi:hypothetical protein